MCVEWFCLGFLAGSVATSVAVMAYACIRVGADSERKE